MILTRLEHGRGGRTPNGRGDRLAAGGSGDSDPGDKPLLPVFVWWLASMQLVDDDVSIEITRADERNHLTRRTRRR